mmetsp:Transcript_1523/g.5228  ORF Transcript_1523/g.5228 Transcript_1523/m.5228 type:complete len:262 (+) Transcript_1523:276-1061(+)|eukprot:CAMPEP_0118896326 /NCGR_PEP_ID=MMETSP1166-20130328/4249_1 /TAXON_ID=1104430 /ORGANISM="Chrysoreinhardia sp, Strain CCMP3193" /LENGTH=261 /DNA_ID=CAMNT_0006835383 /DNA_START=220 /DNA_END=1005 /DNA_ORIENTATION=-
MNGEASQAAPPPPREAGVSFPAPPAVPVHPSLEARLAESEARRDAAELRAERAEEEVAKLRQHLVTFSEKMAAAARESAMDDVPGQRPTMSDAPPPPPPPAAENPPSALATPVAIAPTPTAASTPLGPPASSDLGDDGTNSPDGRSNKRPRRQVWSFNPKWKAGRPWLEYNESAQMMGCKICRQAGESGKWARAGITRLRLEAITSHQNDAKHQRHVKELEAAEAAEAAHLVEANASNATSSTDQPPDAPAACIPVPSVPL